MTRRAWRWTQRTSSAAGTSTSCPHSTTFNSDCTRRSKWLRLVPRDAAASARVSAYSGTGCIDRFGVRAMLTSPSPSPP